MEFNYKNDKIDILIKSAKGEETQVRVTEIPDIIFGGIRRPVIDFIILSRL